MFVFFTACNDEDKYIPPTSTATNQNSNAKFTGTTAVTNSNGRIVNCGSIQAVTEGTTNLQQAACRLEIPKLKGGEQNLFIVHTVPTYGINYCMEYNYTLRAQWWSAYRWDRTNSGKAVKRTDAWAADPLIPQQYRTDESDYSNSGYTRGHIMASEDRVYSREANVQTFYYSNMQPQLYYFNTQGIWWNIENRLIREKYNTNAFRDTLYVVKGGTIREGEYTMAKNIPVPKYFFMALLRKRNDIQANSGYAAIGFWMEHKNNDDANYINYAKSIDQLEQLTGLDFFCNLPDDIEQKVEQEYSATTWKLSD